MAAPDPFAEQPFADVGETSALNVVFALTNAISRAAGLDDIYAAAFDALANGLNVRRASILLFDRDGVMRFQAWRGLSERYRRAVDGHSPWRPDTRDADIIVVPDVEEEPSLAALREPIASEGIRGMVFVPLSMPQGVIGKFMLYSDAPRLLSDAELVLARVIASQVASAAQRLRAEQEARDRDSERREADERLRANEALFRQLADTLPQIIWTSTPDGTPDYFNQRWYEYSGFPAGNTSPNAWRVITHPEDTPRSRAAFEAALTAGEPWQLELRLREYATGSYRWHLARSLPVCDSSGRILRWVGSSTDIDVQKRAEQGSRFLAEASRLLSSLDDFPTALDRVARLSVPLFADWCGVDVLERDGAVRRVALAHWDTASAERTREFERRYPSRPTDGYGPAIVLTTGRSQIVAEITDDVLVACAHDEEHLALLRASGIRSMISVPIKARAEVVGALTFITSDSGRRYSEDDLQLAEELAYRAGIAIENARLYNDLRDADRQKDEFLAVLAHELRNPLAPLRTGLQLVRLAPHDDARRERACAVMERQLQQLVRLVDDLLDVSRITRGKIELQKSRIELGAVIQAAIETSRPAIEAAGHHLSLADAPAPIHLDADATRLAQVFANLLNNAAKYTPRGGRISISITSEDGRAVVRVTDSGIGIPGEMLTSVFDLFAQVDRSLEETHGGLGIGLTLVKRLVEMHGGTVVAHSDGPGTGSEFVVSLPTMTVSDAESAPAAPRPDGAVVPARRILVVDDNRDAAESLAEMLRLQGHHVHVAHDGLSALDAATHARPEVVLLDLGMPRLNGYTAAGELRARLGSDVLLVAVTGWGQEEHRRRSQQVGFDEHLVKPVDPSALDALLSRL